MMPILMRSLAPSTRPEDRPEDFAKAAVTVALRAPAWRRKSRRSNGRFSEDMKNPFLVEFTPARAALPDKRRDLEGKPQAEIDPPVERLRILIAESADIGQRQRRAEPRREQIVFNLPRIDGVEQIMEHHAGGQRVFAAAGVAEHPAESAWTAAAAPPVALRRGRFAEAPGPAEPDVEVELIIGAESIARNFGHARRRIDDEAPESGSGNQAGGQVARQLRRAYRRRKTRRRKRRTGRGQQAVAYRIDSLDDVQRRRRVEQNVGRQAQPEGQQKAAVDVDAVADVVVGAPPVLVEVIGVRGGSARIRHVGVDVSVSIKTEDGNFRVDARVGVEDELVLLVQAAGFVQIEVAGPVAERINAGGRIQRIPGTR